jgi:hypothetical protein
MSAPAPISDLLEKLGSRAIGQGFVENEISDCCQERRVANVNAVRMLDP